MPAVVDWNLEIEVGRWGHFGRWGLHLADDLEGIPHGTQSLAPSGAACSASRHHLPRFGAALSLCNSSPGEEAEVMCCLLSMSLGLPGYTCAGRQAGPRQVPRQLGSLASRDCVRARGSHRRHVVAENIWGHRCQPRCSESRLSEGRLQCKGTLYIGHESPDARVSIYMWSERKE